MISVSLILEYEAVGKRQAQRLKIPETTVDAMVRAFCFTGREVDIYFSLRPFLPDLGDEFLLELAVEDRGRGRPGTDVKTGDGRDVSTASAPFLP